MKKNAIEEEKNREDLGFGSQATSRSARLMKSNGEFNVKKINQGFIANLNVYNRLIMMSWGGFIIFVLSYYVIANLFFGVIYYVIGIEKLQGINANDGLSEFAEAFFFSSQTLTTVGYGRVSPIGITSNVAAALESLIGLMTFAIMTGLLYGRFSRPTPRIRYSKNAIIAPYLGTKALMIRFANEKSNQLTNVEVDVMLSQNEMINGELKRKYYNLDLERSKVKFFATAWTVVHPITEKSILYGKSEENLINDDVEILISIEGIDDTVTDSVYSRRSYLYNEIKWNVSFVPILEEGDNSYIIDLAKIGEFRNVV